MSEVCKKIGHSLVIDMNFQKIGKCRRCDMIKLFSGDWV